jgi:hypothetical protein
MQIKVKLIKIMKYFEDEKNRIQADMAYRVGMIQMQYQSLHVSQGAKFEDTLNLCLLQNLLTNCHELMSSMARENGEELGLKVPLSTMATWGIDAIEIQNDSFEGDLTVEVFLNHLRNAMSHPTGTKIDANFPSSGYNSIADSIGQIGAIGFCNSPDTEANLPRNWSNQQHAAQYLLSGQRSKYPWKRIPQDVKIEPLSSTEFGMFRLGYPYARIFLAVLNRKQLHMLVYSLSNLLAQPVRDCWDGRSVIKIIAA